MKRTYTSEMFIRAVASCRVSNGNVGPLTYDELAQQIAADTGLKPPSSGTMGSRIRSLIYHGYLSGNQRYRAVQPYSLDVTDKGRELIGHALVG